MTERSLGGLGERFAVATPHVAATEAGREVLEGRGNAVDAALAAATTLAVVYPHMCGAGGDLFALVHEPQGRTLAVNATGTSPRALDVSAVRAAHTTMPEHGIHTVTVPGAVSGWSALADGWSNLGLARALEPAIASAREGVPVARSLAASLAWEPDTRRADPGLAEVFFPNSPPLAEGERLVQPALAATLEALAAEGQRALYGGRLGEAYAAGLARRGSAMTVEDLVAHRADVLSPLGARYRDLDVSVTPPTSQGFVLLEILAAIERLGIDPDPLGPDAGALALLFRAASLDRDRHLADPAHMRMHPHSLLDDGHIAALCDEVRTGRPVPVDAGPGPQRGTVGLVTADAEGWAVCLIQSLGPGFGSGILEPETGIIGQGRGSGFTLEPGHPNELAPGKLPAHTLMPVMAQRRGRVAAISGTMGGSAHPQINAMSLVRAFDLGRSAADAVAEPRWLAGGMDPVGPDPFVEAEPAAAASVGDVIRRAGFRVDALEELDESVGHAHLIVVDPDGTFDAGTDPRADGGVATG
ncbi:MAG TPA: gamma-glutamyltransferase [Actinomycetota bacterium]|nr:gamma-glutamyltransferase [Actinomycetota bacterium]